MNYVMTAAAKELWDKGKRTDEIAAILSERYRKEIPEWRIHKVITAERQARLGFKKMQEGARA